MRIGPKGFYCHACKARGGLRKLAKHLGIELNGGAKWELVGSWPYHGSDGRDALFHKDRFRKADGGKVYVLRRKAPEDWGECPHRGTCPAARAEARKRPQCRGGWIHNLQAMPCSPAPQRVLYNEPLLTDRSDEPVHIPGGEKCADALCGLGYVAVTNYDGEGADWRPDDTEKVRGRDAVLWLDADETGRKRGPRVARALWGHVGAIKLIDLYPDRDDGADVFDWIAERRARGVEDDAIRAELDALIGEAPEWERADDAQGSPAGGNQEDEQGQGEPNRRPSMAKVAVDQALAEGIELFHDERGDGCAVVSAPDGRRILSLGSRDFALWLSRLVWTKTGKALGREPRSAAREVLNGLAVFEASSTR